MTTFPLPAHHSPDQVCAVPYRWHDGRLEFCLITSLGKKRWGFPKGIIDPGETYGETALKEAREEAGLSGRIVGEPLGCFEYSKWGTELSVLVVMMEVTQADRHWDEAEMRKRRWAEPDEALQLLARPELKELLNLAVEWLKDRRSA